MQTSQHVTLQGSATWRFTGMIPVLLPIYSENFMTIFVISFPVILQSYKKFIINVMKWQSNTAANMRDPKTKPGQVLLGELIVTQVVHEK